MPKAQIVVDVRQSDEVRAVAEWFERWRDRLVTVSDNLGCGCCVDVWDVEGPLEALAGLPTGVVAAQPQNRSEAV